MLRTLGCLACPTALPVSGFHAGQHCRPKGVCSSLLAPWQQLARCSRSGGHARLHQGKPCPTDPVSVHSMDSAAAPKVCPALGVVRVLRTLDCVMGKTDPTSSTSLTAPQGPVNQRPSRWTALPPQRCVQRSEWSECYARSIASRAGKPLPLFSFRRAAARPGAGQ